jgi:hypothetical protein
VTFVVTRMSIFFSRVGRGGPPPGALVIKQLFLALEKKTSEKKFSFLFIEQIVSVVTDPGIGIQRSDSLALFAGERKSGSSRQGFESLLPGKKHPKLREISQIWATFGTKK